MEKNTENWPKNISDFAYLQNVNKGSATSIHSLTLQAIDWLNTYQTSTTQKKDYVIKSGILESPIVTEQITIVELL